MIVTKNYPMKPRYEHIFSQLKGKILDIGCDTAILDVRAKLNGFDISALDINPNALSQALDNMKDSKVEFPLMFGTIEALPQGTKYDTIILMEIVEHLVHPEQGIKNALKLLNDDGQLLISFPAGLAHYNPDHKNFFFTKEDIDRLEHLWMFDNFPVLFVQTQRVIDIDEFFQTIGSPYNYEIKEYKDSKHPSLDFFIVVKKMKR